jgi:hypothetical protein
LNTRNSPCTRHASTVVFTRPARTPEFDPVIPNGFDIEQQPDRLHIVNTPWRSTTGYQVKMKGAPESLAGVPFFCFYSYFMARRTTSIARSVAPLGLLRDIRTLIEASHQRAASAVNTELTLLFWRIGQRIHSEVLAGRMFPDESIVATVSRQLS